MAKFTFRKEPRETGLAGVGRPNPNTAIKFAGREVGTISAPYYGTPDRKWGVGLMVKEKAGECCPWGWVFFKDRFDTEPEARAWLLGNQSELLAKYTLRDDFD